MDLKLQESDGSGIPAQVSYKQPQNMRQGDLTLADIAKNVGSGGTTGNELITGGDLDCSSRSLPESHFDS